ncbi:MAG: DsbC family protein [Gammaproteobacteria bacterium]|nr:DsbC family protein [Gammaproteobacteria bacterium]
MKNFVKPLLITALLIISPLSQAATDQHAGLREVLSQVFPGLEIPAFKATGIDGVLEFNMGAKVFYVSKDGRYLFQGSLFDLVTQENLTDKAEQTNRVATLEAFGEKNLLTYKAKDEKHSITVFTDVDCPYCRKLHEEVEQYTNNGVSVHYAFLPFKGQKSFDKSVSIWCAKDSLKAMDDAKKGLSIQSATCDNPVKEQMALGQEFGIRGTPAIVLDNGEMVPGYRPAADVLQMFKAKK